MTLKGQARTDYMREYMRRRRAATNKQAVEMLKRFMYTARADKLNKNELVALVAALRQENAELWGELNWLVTHSVIAGASGPKPPE